VPARWSIGLARLVKLGRAGQCAVGLGDLAAGVLARFRKSASASAAVRRGLENGRLELLRDDVGLQELCGPFPRQLGADVDIPAWQVCRCNPRDIGQGCGSDVQLMRSCRLRQKQASALEVPRQSQLAAEGSGKPRRRGGQLPRSYPHGDETGGGPATETKRRARGSFAADGSADSWQAAKSAREVRNNRRPRRHQDALRGRQYIRGHRHDKRRGSWSVGFDSIANALAISLAGRLRGSRAFTESIPRRVQGHDQCPNDRRLAAKTG